MSLKKISLIILACIVSLGSVHSLAFARPKLNAPRVAGEPGWESKFFLRGSEKAANEATPMLKRPYRPLHVYGNMQRRHHYRDTVIPSHRDRTDMLEALTGRKASKNRYRS